MTPLSYHSSNLSLIALEGMRLLVLITDEPYQQFCLQHYFGDYETLYISFFFLLQRCYL